MSRARIRPLLRHVTLLCATALIGAALFYASRFWEFRLWPRPGLWGWDQLPPQGGLVGRWLRGSDLAPFELLIWGVGVFLILTGLERIFARWPDHSGEKEQDQEDGR